jgi:hypothetical protein
MFARLIGLFVVLLIAVHGYFYLAFGTFDPCTAATFKVINQGEPETDNGEGLPFSGRIEEMIRSEGVLACYRIAITGEAPETIP